MDLSIIVPVYQVEKYVRPCMESIFNQGIDDNRFEVIIVNDGTKDRSMEVIADIINQHKNITVINQENQSLSVARNNGIAVAKGEYILMSDSDDLLIENSLSPLLKIALETKVDMVVADFLKIDDKEIANYRVNQNNIKVKEKSGKELILEDLNPYQCYVWRSLFRRKFLIDNDISFIPGINYQDVPFTHECCIKANRCIRTSRLLNIYRMGRPGAATNSFSLQKANSFCIAIANTWKLRQINGLSPDVLYKIEEDVFASFSVMIYRTLYCMTKISERNSVMDTLSATVPTLRFNHNIKQRFTTFMIRKFPHLYINLYYLYSQLFFKK
jgi:glycosyltransferase involved in cell wall biosynthesis